MSYSSKFLEVMDSNIRPKCEPHIVAKATNPDTGVVTMLTWDAKDIQSLSFKRTIDPVGSKLPTMELQWTEVYFGSVSVGNVPQKYKNAMAYMEVDLSFRQYLGFYNTWKSLKSQTWKQVNKMTWKQVKNDPVYETVEMPTLFLAAVPEVKGNLIKWTAKDALSFLTDECEKIVFEDAQLGLTSINSVDIPFFNPVVYLLINSRAQFIGNYEIYNYLTQTILYFEGLDKTIKRTSGAYFKGKANDEIRKYIATRCYYLDFETDKIVVKALKYEYMPVAEVPLKLQYEFPILKRQPKVGKFALKYYRLASGETTQTMSPVSISEYSGEKILKYTLPALGLTVGELGEVGAFLEEYPTAYRIWNSDVDKSEKTDYIEIKNQGNVEYKIRDAGNNKEFQENNSLNELAISDNTYRYGRVTSWYNATDVLELNVPALFNWGIGESAYVETPILNNGQAYKPNCVQLELNLTYTGAVKCKIICKGNMDMPLEG